MLASSPRLVGGVEVGGDAVEESRNAGPFSVWTVMLDRIDRAEPGDASRPVMLAAGDVVRRGGGVVEQWKTRCEV
jgi:hypothetical protein